jgi:feruloyl-CoA synthase
VRQFFQRLIDTLALKSTGATTRIARALLVSEPLSIDVGEVTDKGSINQRAVLKARAALVAELYQDNLPERVIVARTN